MAKQEDNKPKATPSSAADREKLIDKKILDAQEQIKYAAYWGAIGIVLTIITYALADALGAKLYFVTLIFPAYAVLQYIKLKEKTARDYYKNKELKDDLPEKIVTAKEKMKSTWKEIAVLGSIFLVLNNFVIASFLVPTGSMENEVMTGDFLMVNKFIYGASTPRNIMFTNIRLPWVMLPGFKDVKRGDVIVFEFPGYRDEVHPPEFTYYLKRCMALAGDTLEIRNRVVYVNGQPAPLPKNMKFNFNRIQPPGYADERIFPPGAPYNEDNYGPIVIPKKGMVMNISSDNFHQWETFIKRDGHTPVLLSDGTVLIDGKATNQYVVEKDYLFGMGDNRDNSLDSRFWGFIPRENIVGTPMFVYFSVTSTEEYITKLAMKGETMRMEWIYTTFSGHNLALDFVSKVFLVLFNPEMIRFGRIGNVIS